MTERLLLAAITHYDQTMTRSGFIRSSAGFVALGAVLALGGCGSSASGTSGASRPDAYCPAVMRVLPTSVPDSTAAQHGINVLKPIIPQGRDPALQTLILAVERRLEAIKKAGRPNASQLAAYKASAYAVSRYCLSHDYKGRGYKYKGRG